ncbi:MAG TPA: hypothetical protein VGH32_02335 [Pirellulales bacterium]
MDVLAESMIGGGAQLIFLLGLALVIFILLVRSKRYFRQVTQYQLPAPRPARKMGTPKTISAPPRDLEKWEVQMHDLARDLMGQLDSKIRVLELLIRQADEAAARLEAAAAKTGGAPLRRVALERPAAPMPLSPNDASAPQSVRAARNSGEARKPLKVTNNPRFERVYALADAGMSAATIAKQIGTQVGEVELILSLRGKPAE